MASTIKPDDLDAFGRTDHPAYALGQAAFARGAKMSAMADPAFVAVAFGREFGGCLPYFDAWNAGWTDANIAAPVPGWTAPENEALARARDADAG